MRAALEHHATRCRDQPQAFLLNPVDYGCLDVQELWGIEVRADESVRVKHFVLECLGDAHLVGLKLDAFLEDLVTR